MVGALKKQEEDLVYLKHDVVDCVEQKEVVVDFVVDLVDLFEKYLKVVLDVVVDFDYFDFVEKKKIMQEILEMQHNFYLYQFVENKEQK